MALLETLTDDFSGGSRDTAKWDLGSLEFTHATTNYTTSQSGGVLTIDENGASGTVAEGYLSKVTYDLTNSYAYAQVVTTPTSPVNADALLTVGIDSANFYRIYHGETNNLTFDKRVAGTTTVLATVVYSPTTHLWWRIRHGTAGGGSGDTVYLDTSTDGTSWTNRASDARAITITAVKANLEMVTFTSAHIVSVFDNFNTTGAGGGLPFFLQADALHGQMAELAGNMQ